MKTAGIILSGLGVSLGVLYLTVGGPLLAIVLGAISLTLLIISVFGLGIWYAHKSISLGAKLAIDAQANNDKWDTVKMQSLAQFGGEMLKLKGGVTETTNGYPPLLESGQDFNDFNLVITGLEEE